LGWDATEAKLSFTSNAAISFFADLSKSIKRSAIFVHKTRRIGRAQRRDQTRAKAFSV
jgi:hypothetical protein